MTAPPAADETPPVAGDTTSPETGDPDGRGTGLIDAVPGVGARAGVVPPLVTDGGLFTRGSGGSDIFDPAERFRFHRDAEPARPDPPAPSSATPHLASSTPPVGRSTALTAATGFGPSGPAHPVVRAVRCPAFHVNPPTASFCRSCGMAVTDRSVVIVERPSLGFLRFDTGQVVELLFPVVLGRQPTTSAHAARRPEPPRPVAVDDPEKMLSRSHAEVRLEEWQVQIIDLGSLNHTFVQVPGRRVERLRVGEVCPIPSGTRVSLGGVADFRYDGSTA